MAKLARVVAGIEQRLNRIEEKINFLLGEDLSEFEAIIEEVPPPARDELKASKPAEESESVEGAIASEEEESAAEGE